MRRPPNIAALRAAWWARRALRDARDQLPLRELHSVTLPPPPHLPAGAARGVEAFLRRRPHSCLEGALVRQRWLAASGDPRDVVIGVLAPSGDFAAHAWLDGEPDTGGFQELRRLRP